MHVSADTEQLAEALPAFAAVALWGESAQSRRECLDAVLAILDSHAVARPIDGPVPPDNSNPASAYESFRQAFQVGLAAWLVWDRLPLEVRARISSSLIHQAGLAHETLSDPIQLSSRTQPSPDWTGSFLALAGNLFPSHPQADDWTDTAAAAVPSGPHYQTETHEPLLVVGIHETTVTPNVHPPTEADSTPDIPPSLFHGLQSGIFQLLAHRIGNQAPPGPLTRDTRATAELLLFLTLPDGRLFDPTHTGKDAFYRPTLLQMLAGLLVNHPKAGSFKPQNPSDLKTQEPTPLEEGSVQPASIVRSSVQWAADSTLALIFNLMLRNAPDARAPTSFDPGSPPSGIVLLPGSETIVQRHPFGLWQFTWRERPEFKIIPFQAEARPFIHSLHLMGRITALPDEDTNAASRSGIEDTDTLALEVLQLTATTNQFSVSATLTRARGLVDQRSAWIALPDGLAIYLERITARENLSLSELQTASFSLEPFVHHNSTHAPVPIHHGRGEWLLEANAPAPKPQHLGSWFNLAGNFGVILLGPDPWVMSGSLAGEDTVPVIHPANRGRARHDAHDVIAQRAVVLAPGHDHRATAELARTLAREGDLQTGTVLFRVKDWLIDVRLDGRVPETRVTTVPR